MATLEEVQKIARLSRLHLSEDEIPKLQRKFKDVLSYFEMLVDCPTEGVEPLYHATEKSNFRDDVAEAPLSPEELLKNAPETLNQCFHLPRVVAGGE